MCGVKLQWWVDAFDENDKDIPANTDINESSC